MKIKEIEKLAQEDNNNTLRLPKPATTKSQEELNRYQMIMTTVVAGVIENPNADSMLKTQEVIDSFAQDGIRSLKKMDCVKGIYRISTQYGSAEFYDARKQFVGGKYPQWLVPGLCYTNCYTYALFAKNNTKILSGIALMGGTTFLHSVVQVGNMIIDFNYNLVMSAEMYKKMFCFEVLAELESKRIKDTHAWFGVNQDLLSKTNFQSYVINFAYEDLLTYIKKNGIRPSLNSGTSV